MTENPDDNDWQEWWDARLAAIESVLGKADDAVGHAMIPFQMGSDIGGAADIIYFRHHVPGCVSVTSELIGRKDQIANDLGTYELMVCHRDDEQWGENIIRHLAYYTLEAKLNAGDTMDIGEAAPPGSTIAALLFLDYAHFTVRDRKAGLLLCIGITADELDACRSGRRVAVEQALTKGGVFPYTDLYRQSVLKGTGA